MGKEATKKNLNVFSKKEKEKKESHLQVFIVSKLKQEKRLNKEELYVRIIDIMTYFEAFRKGGNMSVCIKYHSHIQVHTYLVNATIQGKSMVMLRKINYQI